MNGKVYLQIAAWRDPLLVETIKNAIKNAEFPELLTFTCVFQGYKQDSWMLESLKHIDAKINLIEVDARVAPLSLCKLRGDVGSSLITDEEYYMQVDSHSKFAPNWDTDLKTELSLARRKYGSKTIITSQITGFTDWDSDFIYSTMTSIPDEKLFNQIGAPVVGRWTAKNPNTQTVERFFNAACIFSLTDFVRDVPQPDSILFQYEQPMMALRTFTAGYTMVGPTKSYVGGFDFPDHQSRFRRQDDPLWSKDWGTMESNNREYFNGILDNNVIDNKNGLMDYLSLDDFVEFMQYDPRTLEVTGNIDIYRDCNYISNEKFLAESNRIRLLND
jgi:hypothetical protein